MVVSQGWSFGAVSLGVRCRKFVGSAFVFGGLLNGECGRQRLGPCIYNVGKEGNIGMPRAGRLERHFVAAAKMKRDHDILIVCRAMHVLAVRCICCTLTFGARVLLPFCGIMVFAGLLRRVVAGVRGVFCRS